MPDITCDNCNTELIVDAEELVSGDIDNDLKLLIDAYGVEKVALAVQEYIVKMLPSTFPRKYTASGIPVF